MTNDYTRLHSDVLATEWANGCHSSYVPTACYSDLPGVSDHLKPQRIAPLRGPGFRTARSVTAFGGSDPTMTTVDDVQRHNVELTQEIQRLRAENELLRSELEFLKTYPSIAQGLKGEQIVAN